MRPLVPGASWPEKIALGYGVGVGVSAMVFFMSMLVPDGAFHIVLIGGLLGLTLATVVPWFRPIPVHLLTQNVRRLAMGLREVSPFHWAAAALIVSLTSLSLLFASYYPGTLPDEAFYDARAWLLANTHEIPFSLEFKEVLVQRPPLTSLAQGLIYLAGGTHAKLIHSGFYICFVLLTWGALDRLVGRREWTWTITTLLATTPILWWHSFLNLANIAAGFYFFAAVITLASAGINMRAGDTRPSRRWLFLAGLCLGLAVTTRLEYVLLLVVPVGMFLALTLHREVSGAVKWVCAGVLSAAVWWSVYVHLFSPWRGNSSLQTFDLVLLAGVAALGVLDHLGAVPWTRRAMTASPSVRLRIAVPVAALAVTVAALLLHQWMSLSFLLTATMQVFLQQRQWVLSVAAVAILLWYQRKSLTGESTLLVLGYYASFVGLALLIAYVANYQRGETFEIFADYHLRLYLTDPTYKIMGSWTRNMIALFPALLLLAGFVPAFTQATAREGVAGLADASPSAVATDTVPGSTRP